MDIQALFLDIDGTLVPEGKPGPSPEDSAALAAVAARGCQVFLCTGRSLGNIPSFLRDAPYLTGIVAGGGGHILLQGTTLFHAYLPQTALTALSEHYVGAGRWCIFEGEEAVYGISPVPWWTLISAPVIHITEPDAFTTTYPGVHITKLTLEQNPPPAEEALLTTWVDLNRFPTYCEGLMKGVNKATGMEQVLAAIGVDRSQVMAIGDSVNDTEMIQYAGCGVAMGNACDELKAIAAHVTTDCDSSGVAAALEQWLG